MLPLLRSLAAGQDHRGGSQQGAALTPLTKCRHLTLTDPGLCQSRLQAGAQGQQFCIPQLLFCNGQKLKPTGTVHSLANFLFLTPVNNNETQTASQK